MNDSNTSARSVKRFSIDEANAMLPLVRSIVTDISDVFRSVTGRRADLHRLLRRGALTSGSLYDDEIAESRSDLQEEYDRIWLYREELESLGVLLRQSEEGYIEFPTTVSGRDAFFSWRIGEEGIQYWRHADSPAATRKQVSPADRLN